MAHMYLGRLARRPKALARFANGNNQLNPRAYTSASQNSVCTLLVTSLAPNTNPTFVSKLHRNLNIFYIEIS